MKKIKVLHIASFTGNIGDNANHAGSENLRKKFLDFHFDITKKEIREFYWGQWSFNSKQFIAEANQYDLIMIGGGNYFELWVEKSHTGTSIDVSIETLKKIKKPILFYALGCDLGQGASKKNVEKFKQFLDHVTDNNKCYVSVRNDGAMKNIKILYGTQYKDKIATIPDGGFFIDIKKTSSPEIEKGKKNIVINLAGDMLEIRFPGKNGFISYNEFVKNFAGLINALDKKHNKNINFIFVPHIFRDLKVTHDVIDNVNDELRRKSVKTAPYLTGDEGYKYIFSLYKQADLILGMRFHANVCAYGLEKNIIGLSNYIQIQNLYQDIKSKEYIAVNKKKFGKLEKMIVNHLSNPKKYRSLSKNTKNALQQRVRKEYKKLNYWLASHFH